MNASILEEIIQERARQDLIHPLFPESQRVSILTEEVGEVAKAYNDLLSTDWEAVQNIHRQNLKEELIQVAAVAIRWLEGLS